MNREGVRKLIANTVINICKKKLFFLNNIKIQGLLGVTIDDHEVILMQIEEGHSLENDHSTKHCTKSLSKVKKNVRYRSEVKFDAIPETTDANYAAESDKSACQANVKIKVDSLSNLRNPLCRNNLKI